MMDLATLIHAVSTTDMLANNGLLDAEQARYCDAGAIAVLQRAGWLCPAEDAQLAVCPGCPMSDDLTVHVRKIVTEKEPIAYVACPQCGYVRLSKAELQQWRWQAEGVAQWLMEQLILTGQPRITDKHTYYLGTVSSKKSQRTLTLYTDDNPHLMQSGNVLPLDQAVMVTGTSSLQAHHDNIASFMALPPYVEGQYQHKASYEQRLDKLRL